MTKIFISYRRADATDAAGRIFDRMVAAFGASNVFKDVDSIPAGSDFADVIHERLDDCDAVLVVIGRFWLATRGHDGTPRLHDARDYVRIEIEKALNSRALVIPALVGNIAMPREDQMPETMRTLARKNAISIRPDPDFHRDMDRLIRSLQEHFHKSNAADAWRVPPVPTEFTAPHPAERTQESIRSKKESEPTAEFSTAQHRDRDRDPKAKWSFSRGPRLIVLLLLIMSLGGVFAVSYALRSSTGSKGEPRPPNPDKEVHETSIDALETVEKLGGRIIRRSSNDPASPVIGVEFNTAECRGGYYEQMGPVLKKLATVKGLRKLGLEWTHVTDTDLKILTAFQELQELELGYTKVTDESLEELAQLKGLQKLHLNYCMNVTDAGLKKLAQLKGLQVVSLYGTKVTKPGVDELRKALPGCAIWWL